MKCSACSYDSNLNKEESNWDFWKMSEINFQLERREFTDEKEILDGTLYVCPKCFTMKIQPNTISTNLNEE